MLTEETVKSALIDHFCASKQITSIVDPDFIFGRKASAEVLTPFIDFGTPVISPYDFGCKNGISVNYTVNCWESSPPKAVLLSYYVQKSLDFFAPEFDLVSCDWTVTRVLPDGEGLNLFRGMVSFNVKAVEKD